MSVRLLFIILIVISFISCKSLDTIYYHVGKSKIRYAINIPKEYRFEGVAGDHEFEKRFWYADSTVIFITTFDNTINYSEIMDQNTHYSKFFALQSGDTLTLSGENKLGLYWKEKVLEVVTIGYANVPASRKATFEKSLLSIKIKRK